MLLRYFSKIISLSIFLCLVVLSIEANAGEPYEIEIYTSYEYISRCNHYDAAVLGQHVYADVVMNRGSEVMLGYDFLIAYDNSTLTCFGAFKNPEIYDSPGIYEWEYFSYHLVDEGDNGYPSGLLQVIGIADQNDGVHHPLTDSNTGLIKRLPENSILFKINFLVTNDYRFACSFMPLSFYWRDCTDNSIAMISSDDPTRDVIQAVSKDVFGYNGTFFPITDPETTFPTFYGASNECLTQNPDNLPLRFIDFKNGGIKIICSDDIDCGTDINLDGYLGGVEDVITFANYFIYGLNAFKINFEGQKASTDVNHDGIILSINDFVYLSRIYTMDVSYPDLHTINSSGNLIASEYSDLLVIESSFDIALGAVQLTFENVTQEYEISLDDDIADMNFKSNLSGDTLKVLIYGIEQGQDIPAGINNLLKINHFGYSPKLISSQVAGYFGEYLDYKTTTIQIPDQIKLSQNFPNPFNCSTKIEFALTNSGHWEIDIFNITGQKVKTLSANDPAGSIQVFWDGTDADNQPVSSGVYFYRLSFEKQSITKKMLLLK